MNSISRTNWESLERMSDEEIDYSEIPSLSESFFERAQVWQRHPKVTISLDVDADIIEWFQSAGKNWEARMQAALRLYVESHKKYCVIR